MWEDELTPGLVLFEDLNGEYIMLINKETKINDLNQEEGGWNFINLNHGTFHFGFLTGFLDIYGLPD